MNQIAKGALARGLDELSPAGRMLYRHVKEVIAAEGKSSSKTSRPELLRQSPV